MTETSPGPAFEALVSARLHLMRGAEWEDYYRAMAPWLQASDAHTRSRAIERLCTAVFWAEGSSVVQARNAGVTLPFQPERRLAWFLDEIEGAHARFDDVIPAFLEDLRYTGDGEPYRSPLLAWLRKLHDAPPPNVRRDIVHGTILLTQSFDEDDAADVSRLVDRLDDPSDYVRGCAARKLSGIDGPHLGAAAAFALIKEKELRRPGVAGPFWSEWQHMTESVPIDPIEWMMDILERRSGPEPEDMPFNGIDFHLHEICDHSPDTVRRMMRGGHVALAIETATETCGVAPGMEPVLRELADHPDDRIRHRAQAHLAFYYKVLHPAAAKDSINLRPDWSEACDTFCFHWGRDRELSTVVLYPRDGHASFDDGCAWSLIDRLMPPALRGDLVNSPIASWDDGPAKPLVLGGEMLWSYASGALVRLAGDVAARRWIRIEVNCGRLGGRWSPFGA